MRDNAKKVKRRTLRPKRKRGDESSNNSPPPPKRLMDFMKRGQHGEPGEKQINVLEQKDPNLSCQNVGISDTQVPNHLNINLRKNAMKIPFFPRRPAPKPSRPLKTW